MWRLYSICRVWRWVFFECFGFTFVVSNENNKHHFLFVIYFHIIILSCLPLSFTAAASYKFNWWSNYIWPKLDVHFFNQYGKCLSGDPSSGSISVWRLSASSPASQCRLRSPGTVSHLSIWRSIQCLKWKVLSIPLNFKLDCLKAWKPIWTRWWITQNSKPQRLPFEKSPA